MLDGLNAAQRRAVETDAAPLCILAGAGSGKTRVLTRRIARRILDGSADPGHVLALTFTRKAAGELRSRLGALGVREQVAAGTFHALAYAQLRRRWADTNTQPPTLMDSKMSVLGRLLPRRRDGGPPVVFADYASEIEWAKARMVRPPDYEREAASARRTPPVVAAEMARIYGRYEDEKRRKGLIDFDDLLLLCGDALDDDAEFAAAQRWRFRHVFVDEFQDVNPVQHRLLMGWLGDRLDLCVVGDPNQAIYSWNGADPTVLTGFTQRFPTADVVQLDDNYRSSPQVLRMAAAVLPTARMTPTRGDGPVPTVRSYDSEHAEARAIAGAAARAHRNGTRWSSMAVLVRTNAQTLVFEQACKAAKVPCRVRGGAVLDQPEVKEAIAGLRRGSPGVPFRSRMADVEATAAEAPPERRQDLEAFVAMAAEYQAIDPTPSVPGFLSWLKTVRNDRAPGDSADVVELATFHRAKGLEWQIVFVAGLERGLIPIGHANSPAAEAEERRLLYVAVTRAQQELHCSWAERRTFGTKSIPRSPSPWLDVLEDACADTDATRPTSSEEWRRRIAGEKAKLRPRKVGSAADPVLLEALKHWRSNAARAAKVPAYVIFHDTTLAAVAEARPASAQELLALPGLGPVKVARYGDALLAVVAQRAS
ncbi:MAG: ATP-dependent helicase UvrD/PcrA [Actinomycetota bacterium]|nr:ATP-dependent helicase UvrD/PcrA [Actinomycetota bacterium]